VWLDAWHLILPTADLVDNVTKIQDVKSLLLSAGECHLPDSAHRTPSLTDSTRVQHQLDGLSLHRLYSRVVCLRPMRNKYQEYSSLEATANRAIRKEKLITEDFLKQYQGGIVLKILFSVCDKMLIIIINVNKRVLCGRGFWQPLSNQTN
jgi:hypothetical protein